jgi:cytochrome c oxidase assembly protein subunit 15
VTWSFLATRKTLGRTHPASRLTLAWLGLIGVQILLGAWTIWSNKAADIATLHVLTGALSLALGGITTVLAVRNRVIPQPFSAASPSLAGMPFPVQSAVPGRS